MSSGRWRVLPFALCSCCQSVVAELASLSAGCGPVEALSLNRQFHSVVCSVKWLHMSLVVMVIVRMIVHWSVMVEMFFGVLWLRRECVCD